MGEEIGRAYLPALENNLQTVGRGTGRAGPTKRRSRRKRREHFQGFDPERATGVTGSVATRHDDALHPGT